jgi:hypothetical protein
MYRSATVKSLIFAGILFCVFVILCLCNGLKFTLWTDFHICGFYFRNHNTLAKISDFTVFCFPQHLLIYSFFQKLCMRLSVMKLIEATKNKIISFLGGRGFGCVASFVFRAF